MIVLLWISTLIIVPILTYAALGFYVQIRLTMDKEFSLFRGMLKFRPFTEEEQEAHKNVQ